MNHFTQHQFTVKSHDRLGAVERILRVIRHRGARIQAMEMKVESNQILNLSFALVTERSIEALQNQISKLVDVITIENNNTK